MFKDDSQKIPTLIALCKLFLGDVKFEIFLISRYFFMVFRMRYPPAHSLPRPFLWKWNVLRWYISHASFIYFWLVIPEFSYFKSFLSSWKYLCRLLLGGFLDVTPRNVVKMVWNFDQWCNAKQCIKYLTGFTLF